MAFCSNRNMGVAVAVAVAVLMAATKVLVEAQLCPKEEYVYPYWTVCTVPALYYQPYYFMSPIVGQGVVVPQWDEANATYYIKFNSVTGAQGAKYVVAPAAATSTSAAIEGAIPLNESVTIYNQDSMRALGWRSEGPDQWALVELTSSDMPASFRFLKVDCFSLPCFSPLTPPRCESYYLVSQPDSSSANSVGWLTHKYLGSTYIRAASTGAVGDLPIFLRDTTWPTTSTPHAAV